MADSDVESGDTDDLLSGVYPLEDVSPLLSPKLLVTPEKSANNSKSTNSTPDSTCFDNSHLKTVKNKAETRRLSRSASPQSRIRVHYTDSAQEALDLANKSYEKLIGDSPDGKSSILINKKDAIRENMERERRKTESESSNKGSTPSSRQTDRSKEMVLPNRQAAEVNKPVRTSHDTESLIQEHIRFAESILASPSSSESDRRSRSLSPSQRQISPTAHYVFIGSRSRSSSPTHRSPVSGLRSRPSIENLPSSRKKLNFEPPAERGHISSRGARERKVQEIRARITNEYINATSGSLTSKDNDECLPGQPVSQSAIPLPYHDSTSTPDNNKSSLRRTAPLSSTPHKPSMRREALRDLSPVNKSKSRDDKINERTTPNTPSTYIKGLQSVRVGLRQLMNDELSGDNSESQHESSLSIKSRSDDINARIDSTINAENQLLRDQLNRERNMRKQIEADKHELQSQLLESKDRLHHLSSVLKQKDDMMRKLDQNLEEVVGGWQKHEQENKHQTELLTHKIRRLERELAEQQRHAASLENDLLNAVDDLKKEQENNKDYIKDLSDQQGKHQTELAEVKKLLTAEQDKSQQLELEKHRVNEGRKHVEKQLESLQHTLDQERQNFKGREEELLNKINEITSVQIAVLEKEAARSKEQAVKIEELYVQVKKFETEAESLRHVLDSKSKEVERLQSKVELLEAEHETNVRQLESKLKMELEVRLSQAKDDGLKRLADSELNLQQTHQRQMAEVITEHNRQLGELKERYKNEMNRVKSHCDHKVKSVESSLQESRQELEAALIQKTAVESQRDDLTARLQSVLKLLGGTAFPEMAAILPNIELLHRHSNSLSHLPSNSLPYNHSSQLTPEHQNVDVSPVTPQRVTQAGNSNSTPFKLKDRYSSNDGRNTTSGTDTTDGGQNVSQTAVIPSSTTQPSNTSGSSIQEHQHEVEDNSSIITNGTYDINEDDTEYRHKRQAELQDYIKKLLNRSVGEPLVETRVDLDESRISIISGLGDGKLSPKKAFKLEVVGQTPPVKGSSRKVDPKEIASLINKYGSDSAAPHTDDYIQYLKTVNQKASEQRDLMRNTAKKDLTKSFTTSANYDTSTKRTSGAVRLTKLNSPDKATAGKPNKDSKKIKRHHSLKSQPVWK